MYRLYVDEVGTDNLTNTDKDKSRYLSLTGVAMPLAYARDEFTPNMNWIKGAVFDQDPDDPIVLHRKEIMGGKGPFEILRAGGKRYDQEKHDLFDRSILRLFEITDYTVITALIDKQWMLRQRHWRKNHPYHYLMEILVEKYVQLLERIDSIGDIMPESRNQPDDPLQAAFEEVRNTGTDFVSSERIFSRLRGSKLKFRKKQDNIAGLQLCDLLAHPSHIHARLKMRHDVNLGPFATQVIARLEENKYDRSSAGKIVGYGIKFLPQ